MIERLPDPAAAEAWCARRRARGETIGFVATMGALHAGHVDLVQRARAENDAVCASVFVNPLQFDDPADLADYPRDLAGDAALLDRIGCGMVFTGTLEQFFPHAASRAATCNLVRPMPTMPPAPSIRRSISVKIFLVARHD